MNDKERLQKQLEVIMGNSIYGAFPSEHDFKPASYILARELKYKLKHVLKGEVKTSVCDDTLIVDVYGANSTVFRYTMKHITSEIVQGFTSEMACNIIVKRYKSYINNLYFL